MADNRSQSADLHVANSADGGSRLDRFLAGRIETLSRARLQDLIRGGHVIRIGEQGDSSLAIDPSLRVRTGDSFEVNVPATEPDRAGPEPIDLTVVYEDDSLIVIDKPAGLVVHPGAGNATGTLVNALIAHCGSSLSGIGGIARPGIVHRLDKDTSGLMVVAKTDTAHRSLAAQFADHGRTGDLRRGYLALVWGELHPGKGSIETLIGRHPASRMKMAVLDSGGRTAVTHYETVRTYRASSRNRQIKSKENSFLALSLVRCYLETGRTHQVRVHLAHLGAPIVGDQVYASGFRTKAQALPAPAGEGFSTMGRQALHAARLQFNHPTSGKIRTFESDLPADIAKLCNLLEGLETKLSKN